MNSLSSNTPQDNPVLKTCTKCNRELPATLGYFPSGKYGLTSRCKQCRDEYNAAYYAAHRVDVSQQRKDYYQEHREHLTAYSARYRIEHPEEVKQAQTSYNKSEARKLAKARHRATHREENKQYNIQWHKEHKEEQRQYGAQYNATHREERIAYYRRRRAEHREELNARHRQYRSTDHARLLHRTHENNRRVRKLAIPGTLTPEQIQQKLRLQRFKCYYCHDRFERRNGKYIFHLEHTIPISRLEHNPRHDVNYVVLACPTCNSKKNDKLPHEWGDGGRLF